MTVQVSWDSESGSPSTENKTVELSCKGGSFLLQGIILCKGTVYRGRISARGRCAVSHKAVLTSAENQAPRPPGRRMATKGLSHLFSETALEFVLTAESRHFCAVMAQKATSLGKFLRNLLKNRLCCRFFKPLPLNETAAFPGCFAPGAAGGGSP